MKNETMKIKRIKWNGVNAALLALITVFVGIAFSEPLGDLRRGSGDFLMAGFSSEESGALALGMILITLIAALKLLVQKSK